MNVIVVGGGPAGLAAADELCRLGVTPVVVESQERVGGLSATHRFGDFRFDIGGHRFFSQSALVNDRWREWMGEEMLVRPRLSRIYFRDKFFPYPLEAFETLAKLGVLESGRIAASYAAARLRPRRPETSFEDWVCNRFGERLFRLFFKSYTEKVWGMPCSAIGADWAAQRIRNLDLPRAVLDSLRLGKGSGDKAFAKTLVRSFHYPRFGPGQMWERVAERLSKAGATILMNTAVERLRIEAGRVVAVDVAGPEGRRSLSADAVISSTAIGHLAAMLDPAAPPPVRDAAAALKHRDFLTVGLVVGRESLFPDQWLYIHSDAVRVGRIQNYNNWSPDMCPVEDTTLLGFEYFVNRGEPLWNASDDELIDLAGREGAALGLLERGDVVGGTVIRADKAYPVYDSEYRANLDMLQRFLSGVANLWTVGRNGLHRYNNQDHSMLSGIYAARNATGPASYDVWNVNTAAEYHESGTFTEHGADRLVPVAVRD